MLLRLDDTDRVLAANDRYLDRTGYRHDDVRGRMFWDELLSVGSRVLYQTQLAPVLQLDRQLDEVMVDLRTADGRGLPALMNVIRSTDSDGRVVETALALMTVHDRRAYENRLRQARDEAERAHRTAEQARREADEARRQADASRAETERAWRADARTRLRLELLAHANTALASSLELSVALHQLARVLADGLADWCIIHVPEPGQAATVGWSAAHTDPVKQTEAERLAQLLPKHADPQSPLWSVLAGGEGTVITEVSAQQRHGSTDSDEVRALYSTVGLASVIVVPATLGGAHVATIAVGRGEHRAAFDRDDFADLADVAARTGIVIDNLRRQAREHSNSITLQHALLTTPPDSARCEMATRYLPATHGNEVGGDWYDALLLHDGSPVAVIGDVVGHDIHAAAAMGQLRGIIRTLAYTTGGSPGDILAQADATAHGLSVDVVATVVIARVETSGAGVITLHWSNAGHPPPLLITESGVEVLTTEPDRLLGLPVTLQQQRRDHQRSLRAGDTLVLYTDGLIERTDQTIDHGIAALAAHLADAYASSLDDLCDLIVEARSGDTYDDVAMIVLRVLPSD